MPCQSLDWTDSSLSSRGIRLHLPLNTEWCSPGFSNADCTSIIWWSAPGNPWAHNAPNRGRMWAAKETAPTRQPPLPFQTFRRLFLHFVKPAFLKSLKWQASFPQISPFRNILKMEHIFIGSSQQKPNRLFSLTYPIAVLAQTDQILQVAEWYKMGNP